MEPASSLQPRSNVLGICQAIRNQDIRLGDHHFSPWSLLKEITWSFAGRRIRLLIIARGIALLNIWAIRPKNGRTISLLNSFTMPCIIFQECEFLAYGRLGTSDVVMIVLTSAPDRVGTMCWKWRNEVYRFCYIKCHFLFFFECIWLLISYFIHPYHWFFHLISCEKFELWTVTAQQSQWSKAPIARWVTRTWRVAYMNRPTKPWALCFLGGWIVAWLILC